MPVAYQLKMEFTRPDLEQALLAAVTAQPDLYWQILDILPTEALTAVRQTWEELAQAIEQGAPLPFVEGTPANDPIATARELAGLYQKRLLADVAQRFLADLRSNTSATELITELENELTKAQQAVRELRAGQVVALPELLPQVVADVAARRQAVKEQGAAAVGLSTGIPKLDKLLGGLQPGLFLLAAEPGMGKTTFTLQLAAYVAQTGYPALFVSFEESLPRLALKAICARARLETKKFADGYGDPAELERAVSEYGPRLGTLNFVEGTAQLTVPELRAKALQLMARWKTNRCLVIVDYLQRWAAGRREFTDFRHIVSGLVSELRELAMRLNSPVLVISSQNRPGQGAASLTSLKESGDLEYSADAALFLVEAKNRAATPPARAVDLVLEKNRFGDKGAVGLIFRPDIGTFAEEARR